MGRCNMASRGMNRSIENLHRIATGRAGICRVLSVRMEDNVDVIVNLTSCSVHIRMGIVVVVVQ